MPVNKNQPLRSLLGTDQLMTQPTLGLSPIVDQMGANQWNRPLPPQGQPKRQASLMPPTPSMTPPVQPPISNQPKSESSFLERLGILSKDALSGLGDFGNVVSEGAKDVGGMVSSGLSGLGDSISSGIEAITPERETVIALAGGLSDLGAGLQGRQGTGMQQIQTNLGRLEANRMEAKLNDPNSDESKFARQAAMELFPNKIKPDMTAKQLQTVMPAFMQKAQQDAQMRMAQMRANQSSEPKVKPATESERLASGFAKRTQNANSVLSDLENKFISDKGGYSPSGFNVAPIERWKSKERKDYETAQNDFVSAVLRKESGASISDEEFERERRKYFPMPGDTPENIRYKQLIREQTIDNLRQASGQMPNQIVIDQKTGKRIEVDAQGNKVRDL